MAEQSGSDEEGEDWRLDWHWIGYILLVVLFVLLYRCFRVLFEILLKLNRCLFARINPKYGRRLALLQWIEKRAERRIYGFSELWENPEILSIVVDTVIPQAYEEDDGDEITRHEVLQHIQSTLSRYFEIRPMFLGEELKLSWDRKVENKFIRLLHLIKASIERLERTTKQEDASEYVARGMGLITATKGHAACFFVYSRHELDFDSMRITITGPMGDVGETTVIGSREDVKDHIKGIKIKYEVISNAGSLHEGVKKCLKVVYTPNQAGAYRLEISKHSYVILGSPFIITVDPPSRKMPTSGTTSKSETRVINRIVDFVNEKMLLTDKGELIKISSDAQSNLALTTLKTKMNEQSSVAISLAKILQKDAAREKKPTPEVFFEICEYIMKTCHFILKNSSRSRGLRLISGANKCISRDSLLLDDGIITEVEHTEQEMKRLLENRTTLGKCSMHNETGKDPDVAFIDNLLAEDTEVPCPRVGRRRKFERHRPYDDDTSQADSLDDDVFSLESNQNTFPKRPASTEYYLNPDIIMNRSQLVTPDIVYVNLLETEEPVICRQMDVNVKSAPGSLSGAPSSERSINKAREFFKQNKEMKNKDAVDYESIFFKSVEESPLSDESHSLSETNGLSISEPSTAECPLPQTQVGESTLKNAMEGSFRSSMIRLTRDDFFERENVQPTVHTFSRLETVKYAEKQEGTVRDWTDVTEGIEDTTIESTTANISVRKIINDFERMLQAQNEQVENILSTMLDHPNEKNSIPTQPNSSSLLEGIRSEKTDNAAPTPLSQSLKSSEPDSKNTTVLTEDDASKTTDALESKYALPKPILKKNEALNDEKPLLCAINQNKIEIIQSNNMKYDTEGGASEDDCVKSLSSGEKLDSNTMETKFEHKEETQRSLKVQSSSQFFHCKETIPHSPVVGSNELETSNGGENFQTELSNEIVAPFECLERDGSEQTAGSVQEELLQIGKTLVEALMRHPIQTDTVKKVIKRVSLRNSLSAESVQIFLSSIDESTVQILPEAKEEYMGAMQEAVEVEKDPRQGDVSKTDSREKLEEIRQCDSNSCAASKNERVFANISLKSLSMETSYDPNDAWREELDDVPNIVDDQPVRNRAFETDHGVCSSAKQQDFDIIMCDDENGGRSIFNTLKLSEEADSEEINLGSERTTTESHLSATDKQFQVVDTNVKTEKSPVRIKLKLQTQIEEVLDAVPDVDTALPKLSQPLSPVDKTLKIYSEESSPSETMVKSSSNDNNKISGQPMRDTAVNDGIGMESHDIVNYGIKNAAVNNDNKILPCHKKSIDSETFNGTSDEGVTVLFDENAARLIKASVGNIGEKQENSTDLAMTKENSNIQDVIVKGPCLENAPIFPEEPIFIDRSPIDCDEKEVVSSKRHYGDIENPSKLIQENIEASVIKNIVITQSIATCNIESPPKRALDSSNELVIDSDERLSSSLPHGNIIDDDFKTILNHKGEVPEYEQKREESMLEKNVESNVVSVSISTCSSLNKGEHNLVAPLERGDHNLLNTTEDSKPLGSALIDDVVKYPSSLEPHTAIESVEISQHLNNQAVQMGVEESAVVLMNQQTSGLTNRSEASSITLMKSEHIENALPTSCVDDHELCKIINTEEPVAKASGLNSEDLISCGLAKTDESQDNFISSKISLISSPKKFREDEDGCSNEDDLENIKDETVVDKITDTAKMVRQSSKVCLEEGVQSYADPSGIKEAESNDKIRNVRSSNSLRTEECCDETASLINTATRVGSKSMEFPLFDNKNHAINTLHLEDTPKERYHEMLSLSDSNNQGTPDKIVTCSDAVKGSPHSLSTIQRRADLSDSFQPPFSNISHSNEDTCQLTQIKCKLCTEQTRVDSRMTESYMDNVLKSKITRKLCSQQTVAKCSSDDSDVELDSKSAMHIGLGLSTSSEVRAHDTIDSCDKHIEISAENDRSAVSPAYEDAKLVGNNDSRCLNIQDEDCGSSVRIASQKETMEGEITGLNSANSICENQVSDFNHLTSAEKIENLQNQDVTVRSIMEDTSCRVETVPRRPCEEISDDEIGISQNDFILSKCDNVRYCIINGEDVKEVIQVSRKSNDEPPSNVKVMATKDPSFEILPRQKTDVADTHKESQNDNTHEDSILNNGKDANENRMKESELSTNKSSNTEREPHYDSLEDKSTFFNHENPVTIQQICDFKTDESVLHPESSEKTSIITTETVSSSLAEIISPNITCNNIERKNVDEPPRVDEYLNQELRITVQGITNEVSSSDLFLHTNIVGEAKCDTIIANDSNFGGSNVISDARELSLVTPLNVWMDLTDKGLEAADETSTDEPQAEPPKICDLQSFENDALSLNSVGSVGKIAVALRDVALDFEVIMMTDITRRTDESESSGELVGKSNEKQPVTLESDDNEDVSSCGSQMNHSEEVGVICEGKSNYEVEYFSSDGYLAKNETFSDEFLLDNGSVTLTERRNKILEVKNATLIDKEGATAEQSCNKPSTMIKSLMTSDSSMDQISISSRNNVKVCSDNEAQIENTPPEIIAIRPLPSHTAVSESRNVSQQGDIKHVSPLDTSDMDTGSKECSNILPLEEGSSPISTRLCTTKDSSGTVEASKVEYNQDELHDTKLNVVHFSLFETAHSPLSDQMGELQLNMEIGDKDANDTMKVDFESAGIETKRSVNIFKGDELKTQIERVSSNSMIEHKSFDESFSLRSEINSAMSKRESEQIPRSGTPPSDTAFSLGEGTKKIEVSKGFKKSESLKTHECLHEEQSDANSLTLKSATVKRELISNDTHGFAENNKSAEQHVDAVELNVPQEVDNKLLEDIKRDLKIKDDGTCVKAEAAAKELDELSSMSSGQLTSNGSDESVSERCANADNGNTKEEIVLDDFVKETEVTEILINEMITSIVGDEDSLEEGRYSSDRRVDSALQHIESSSSHPVDSKWFSCAGGECFAEHQSDSIINKCWLDIEGDNFIRWSTQSEAISETCSDSIHVTKELDFESIITAPNLDVALRKLEQKLNNAQKGGAPFKNDSGEMDTTGENLSTKKEIDNYSVSTFDAFPTDESEEFRATGSNEPLFDWNTISNMGVAEREIWGLPLVIPHEFASDNACLSIPQPCTRVSRPSSPVMDTITEVQEEQEEEILSPPITQLQNHHAEMLPVITLTPEQSVDELVEQSVFDKNKLLPLDDSKFREDLKILSVLDFMSASAEIVPTCYTENFQIPKYTGIDNETPDNLASVGLVPLVEQSGTHDLGSNFNNEETDNYSGTEFSKEGNLLHRGSLNNDTENQNILTEALVQDDSSNIPHARDRISGNTISNETYNSVGKTFPIQPSLNLGKAAVMTVDCVESNEVNSSKAEEGRFAIKTDASAFEETVRLDAENETSPALKCTLESDSSIAKFKDTGTDILINPEFNEIKHKFEKLDNVNRPQTPKMTLLEEIQNISKRGVVDKIKQFDKSDSTSTANQPLDDPYRVEIRSKHTGLDAQDVTETSKRISPPTGPKNNIIKEEKEKTNEHIAAQNREARCNRSNLVSFWKMYWDKIVEENQLNECSQPSQIGNKYSVKGIKTAPILLARECELLGSVEDTIEEEKGDDCADKGEVSEVNMKKLNIVDRIRLFENIVHNMSLERNYKYAQEQEALMVNFALLEDETPKGFILRSEEIQAKVEDDSGNGKELHKDQRKFELERNKSFQNRFIKAREFFELLEKHSYSPGTESISKESQKTIFERSLPCCLEKLSRIECRKKRRKRKSSRRQLEKGIIQSAPTSDSETPSHYPYQMWGSERLGQKVVERIHIKDLFEDFYNETDRTGLFRGGVPNKKAVLASLRSIDLLQEEVSEITQCDEDDITNRDLFLPAEPGNISKVPRGYQNVYPWIPTTPIHQYRSRPCAEHNLIPRNALLQILSED